jgi:hypothetical protein
MFALARKLVFGLLATALVIGIADVAMAKPPQPKPWPHPWPIYVPGPVVVVRPVGVYYPVNPIPAEIQLSNPVTNQVALRYVLNGGPVQLLPAGCRVAIHQESVIAFDRGGAAGWTRYSLTGGAYKFVPANGTWSLVRETIESVPSSAMSAAANPVPAN